MKWVFFFLGIAGILSVTLGAERWGMAVWVISWLVFFALAALPLDAA